MDDASAIYFGGEHERDTNIIIAIERRGGVSGPYKREMVRGLLLCCASSDMRELTRGGFDWGHHSHSPRRSHGRRNGRLDGRLHFRRVTHGCSGWRKVRSVAVEEERRKTNSHALPCEKGQQQKRGTSKIGKRSNTSPGLGRHSL